MTPIPSRQAFLEYRGDASHAALSVSLLADGETPISLYRKLAAGRPEAFLLESVEGGERMGRYSFIGHSRRTFRFRDGQGTLGAEPVTFTDPLTVLRDALAGWSVWSPRPLPRFTGGAVGYLGFDCIRYFEPSVPLPKGAGPAIPEGAWQFVGELAIYDHVSRRLLLVVHAPLVGDRAAAYAQGLDRLHALVGRLAATQLAPEGPWPLDPGEPEPEGPAPAVTEHRTAEDLEAAVQAGRAAIEAGEIFQVVVSERVTVEAAVDPLTLYRALRAINPSPYMFLLKFGDFALVGASPEVLVRLEDDEVLVRPIAGTRPRGDTEAEDAAHAADLLADPKELAEHRMLLDLGRNDVGRVAQAGTVAVHDREHIERYSHVMHLTSNVEAAVRPDLDALDVLRATFPAGTLSGAPKVR
ncbi:MAG: chorismate-binding protein, partial [Myxococcales bacterium]|nr:chorismate-binding protein [Myxococcales bacterium]